jgi:glycosyltransferase involved in cell wall biosynthesis
VRVALSHDWLTGMRGGERVLHELARHYPDADLYTLFHVPGATSEAIESLRIHASVLSGWPGAAGHYRKLLPLFPWAVRQLRPRGHDLVLSTHHAVAKNLDLEPGTPHLCYCFTPMRYVWDQTDAYLGSGLRRQLASPLISALRRFDVRYSDPRQVTRFVAISRTVAERIRRHYGREANVIHPPVDVDLFRPREGGPEDYYLMVGGFVPYKREDLAMKAFERLERTLVVAGDGPGLEQLRETAPPNVVFTGRVSDAELAELYAGCRALVYPQLEDFGLIAVEAQAAGRPVIAYAGEGALDSVRPLLTVNERGEQQPGVEEAPTGIFFATQQPEALRRAIECFESEAHRFEPKSIRAHAEGFGAERFFEALDREIQATLAAAV